MSRLPIAALVCVALLTPRVAPADRLDYTAFTRWVGGVATPGTASDVVIAGTLAYVADGLEGLQIADVSVADQPVIVGSVDTSGDAHGVAVGGDYAYIAARSNGLRVIDVSIPAEPELVASLDTPGDALDIVVVGSLLHLADGAGGLRIYDVGNPLAPVLRDAFLFAGEVRGVAVESGQACVALGLDDGMAVLDVSDPDDIGLTGSLALAGFSHDLKVAGAYAFIASANGAPFGGVHVVDISTASAPTLTESHFLVQGCQDLVVDGPRIYAGDLGAGLMILDATDPGNLANLAAADAPGGNASSSRALALRANHAYLVDGLGLQVVDLSIEASALYTGLTPLSDEGSGVELVGTSAYVAAGSSLSVLDVTVEDQPVEIGSVANPSDALDVDVVAGFAYVASRFEGLQIVDVTTPTAPSAVGILDTPGVARGVTVAAGHAYVADQSTDLSVIDVSTSEMPSLLTTVLLNDSARGVLIDGGFLYVAATTAFHVLNLVNPSAPVVVGTVGGLGRAERLAIDGDHAYVADDIDGLHVIDVTDPSAPSLVASLSLPGLFGSAKGIAVADGWAYVATSFSGVQIVDVSDPGAPSLVGNVGTAGTDLPGTEATILLVRDVALSPTRVFAAGGIGSGPFGLAVAKLAGPVGTSVLADPSSSFDVSVGEFSPNPFVGATVVRFALSAAQPIVVDLYDVAGRRVRRLDSRWRESGTHEVPWDGRDDRGGLLGAGVYFARLSGEGGHTVRKVVHLGAR